jgi:5-methylcytosine-specific restriction endonuclease McrA
MMTKRRPRQLRGKRQQNKIRFVGDRDGWVCWICENPIAEDVSIDHPERASLDHVVPLRDGGPNANENLRIAHACCNESRDRNLNRAWAA